MEKEHTSAIVEAAKKYLQSAKPSIQREYGDHYRTFCAGADWRESTLDRVVNSLVEALKFSKHELKEFSDYWEREADSYNHPAQDQERRLCIARMRDVQALLNKIEDAINHVKS